MRRTRHRKFRAQHERRISLVWWDDGGRLPIGVIVQRAPTEKRSQEIRPGAGLPAWISRAEARRLRDALTEALA